MSGVTVPLGAVQKLPEDPITPRRTVVQTTTWYTCPAGKKAIVKGRVTCTGLGAAAEGRFSAAGTIMFRWIANVSTGVSFSIPDSTSQIVNGSSILSNPPINVYRNFEVELAAGETIETSQDSGTNAEFNVFATSQETPT